MFGKKVVLTRVLSLEYLFVSFIGLFERSSFGLYGYFSI